MNQAKALLSGTYKWGRRTGKVMHHPLLDFQMPKSTYVAAERLPPEVDDIAVILSAAFEHTPDIAPILVLAATTGARLGELIAPRRSDIDWNRSLLRIRSATDIDGSLKDPKREQHRRDVPLDEGTLVMLRGVLDEMEERCAAVDAHTADDPFLFSMEPDGSRPLTPDRVTKRLQVLKGYLGVEDKKEETIALEEDALRLRRSGSMDRRGKRGPSPATAHRCRISMSVRRWAVRTVRRILSRQELWNGNRERFSNLLRCNPNKNIVRWAWVKYPDYSKR
ncbi:MAG: hypothetical protein ACRDZT_01535 [Acidimicrobiales bacterium]